MSKIQIKTLSNIAPAGLERFPVAEYEISSELESPDVILVRSTNMHDMDVSASVLAIGRAGAGVNNIPLEKMVAQGVPVFNAPGANANAVKELVIAGMLLAARNIPQAWSFANAIDPGSERFNVEVENGKKAFKGFELPGKTLGVIGLGAIGASVANTALNLGMDVIGYDPGITVKSAWQLSSRVKQAKNVDDLLDQSDMVTVHVPLIDATRAMINASRLKIMRDGAVILNFSRAGIIEDRAVLEAIESGKIHAYVCDFPSPELQDKAGVIALPHLGASTAEAEDNCAIMVAEQIRAYIEDGKISNSVNFPEVELARKGQARISVINQNQPDMISSISQVLGAAGVNIEHLVNESRDEIAYTLIDVSEPVSDEQIAAIEAVDGVIRVRVI